MPPIVEEPIKGVIHVIYNAQLTLTKAFMRLQEFYESPLGDHNGNFQGRYFTRDDFKKAYAESCGTTTKWGDFSYYTDWNGFNVPGHIVDDFMDKFSHDIDFMEEYLFDAIRENRPTDGSPYCVIGTWLGDEDCIDHELAHAMWYLHPEYRNGAAFLAGGFEDDFVKAVFDQLEEDGYARSVRRDEMNAYLATNTMIETHHWLGLDEYPWDKILHLQIYFTQTLEKKQAEE
jgi:hypothetical protein